MREDSFAWIVAGYWQTASQMLEEPTLRDNAIGCTQSLLPCSLWTYQSSLTYVFKAVLLAACSSFHGNPIAISPHCLDCWISWKLFFFESWFIKAGKTTSGQKDKSLFYLASLCVYASGCVHVWYTSVCMHVRVLHMTFRPDTDMLQSLCCCLNRLMSSSLNCGKALNSSESTSAFQSLLGRMDHSS